MAQIDYLCVLTTKIVWKSKLFSTNIRYQNMNGNQTTFFQKMSQYINCWHFFFFFFQNQPIQKMSQILFNGVPCEVSCSVKIDSLFLSFFCQYCVEYQIPERHRRDGGQRLFTATGALYSKRCMPRSVISFGVTILSMTKNFFDIDCDSMLQQESNIRFLFINKNLRLL